MRRLIHSAKQNNWSGNWQDDLKTVLARFTLCTLTCLLFPSIVAAETAVYYFHGTMRCETCLMTEQFAENVLEQEFAQELERGTLSWRPVNVDLPEE
jgi:hypothetical protein